MDKDIGELILKEVKEFRKDMNDRVRSLEIWRGSVKGGLKIVGVIIGLSGVIFAIVRSV